MMNVKEPYMLVFGISIYDIIGFTYENYKPYDSNPGRVRISHGGVCRNIAENMARVGVNTKLMSILGKDDKGKSILDHAQKMKFDMSDSLIVAGGSTPTYIAILDDKGEMVSAVVDIKIADCLSETFIDSKAEIIKASEYMILDTDNPSIVEYIVKKHEHDTKFILDTVSTAKAKKVKHVLKYFHTIKPNRYEAEVLCGFPLNTEEDIREAGQYFRGLGIQNVFISLDADGVYYNNGQEEGIVKVQGVKVVNVTGAGDAFVAGMGYGYMHHMDIKDIIKFAMTMSVITIAHAETIHPKMQHDFVIEHMTQLKWIEIDYNKIDQ